MIGIAVASQELHFVDLSLEDKLTLPYSEAGLKEILAHSEDSQPVLLAGNKQWATTLAYALKANNREVYYIASPKQSRGAKQNHSSLLRKALEKNYRGRLFFKETIQPELHPDVVLGNEYFLLMNEVRRIKHRVINNLRLVFPELLGLGDKLWSDKRSTSLASCHWQDFEKEIGVCINDSVAKYVPNEAKAEAENNIRALMVELNKKETEAEDLRCKIFEKTEDHKVAKFLGGSPTAHLVALFLGWRKWGTKRNSKTGFRAIRHFVGLDVSRMDGKGKMRISRSRPNVRTAIFWALKTTAGKGVIGPFVSARKANEMKTPFTKRIERLLLLIWQNCLKEEKTEKVEI